MMDSSLHAVHGRARSSTFKDLQYPAPLCPLADVAIISAAITGDEAKRFDELTLDSSNIFSAAACASRRERLQALAVFRTRSVLTRQSLVSAEEIPPWARSRLPAGAIPIDPAASFDLSLEARQVVDAAIHSPHESYGPGFGSWSSPSLVFEDQEDG